MQLSRSWGKSIVCVLLRSCLLRYALLVPHSPPRGEMGLRRLSLRAGLYGSSIRLRSRLAKPCRRLRMRRPISPSADGLPAKARAVWKP